MTPRFAAVLIFAAVALVFAVFAIWSSVQYRGWRNALFGFAFGALILFASITVSGWLATGRWWPYAIFFGG